MRLSLILREKNNCSYRINELYNMLANNDISIIIVYFLYRGCISIFVIWIYEFEFEIFMLGGYYYSSHLDLDFYIGFIAWSS